MRRLDEEPCSRLELAARSKRRARRPARGSTEAASLLDKSEQESTARAADAEGLSGEIREGPRGSSRRAAVEVDEGRRSRRARATAERDAAAQRADAAKAAATKAAATGGARRLRGAALEGEIGTMRGQSKELQEIEADGAARQSR